MTVLRGGTYMSGWVITGTDFVMAFGDHGWRASGVAETQSFFPSSRQQGAHPSLESINTAQISWEICAADSDEARTIWRRLGRAYDHRVSVVPDSDAERLLSADAATRRAVQRPVVMISLDPDSSAPLRIFVSFYLPNIYHKEVTDALKAALFSPEVSYKFAFGYGIGLYPDGPDFTPKSDEDLARIADIESGCLTKEWFAGRPFAWDGADFQFVKTSGHAPGA